MKNVSRLRAATVWIALTAAVVAPGAATANEGGDALSRMSARAPGASMLATFRIEAWLKKELPGGDYAAELVRAYQERAKDEAGYSSSPTASERARPGKRNWLDATAFFSKAERAAEGEETPPWSPFELGLSNALLIAAHRATIRRSLRYRGEAPDACAQMVALFDHWIERQKGRGAAAPTKGKLFERWAEAFRACSAPVEIFGFPIGACANTDNDQRLADAPERGRRERRKAEHLAEEIGTEEAAGLLALVDASIRVEGHASATGGARGEKSLGGCRAIFMKELLVVAGVATDRIAVDDRGTPPPALDGVGGDGGESYRHRRVVVRLD